MKQVRLSAFCLIHFLFSFKAEQSTLKGVCSIEGSVLPGSRECALLRKCCYLK